MEKTHLISLAIGIAIGYFALPLVLSLVGGKKHGE